MAKHFSTNRTELVTQTLSVDEFIDLLVKNIDNLTAHSYISKCQARYLKSRKENLPDNSMLVLGDFAENYTFLVQDIIALFTQLCLLQAW